jgi:hypothetical protein
MLSSCSLGKSLSCGGPANGGGSGRKAHSSPYCRGQCASIRVVLETGHFAVTEGKDVNKGGHERRSPCFSLTGRVLEAVLQCVTQQPPGVFLLDKRAAIERGQEMHHQDRDGERVFLLPSLELGKLLSSDDPFRCRENGRWNHSKSLLASSYQI